MLRLPHPLALQPGDSLGLELVVGGGIQGDSRPTRSLNGPGSLQQQPQPTSTGNVGGRTFSSFSNPYSR